MSLETNFMSDAMTRVEAPRLETHWSRIFYVDLFAAEPARRLDSPPRGDERVSEQFGAPTFDNPSRTRAWARRALAWLDAHRSVRPTSVNSMAD
jgi:hypothetical protein